MALLKIESGEVTRHVGTRGGFAIAETVTLPDGRSFPKTYTVWYEGTDTPALGSIVSVTGVMSAKAREYQAASGTKTAIDISINEPTIQVLGSVPPVAQLSEGIAIPAPQAADQGLPF